MFTTGYFVVKVSAMPLSQIIGILILLTFLTMACQSESAPAPYPTYTFYLTCTPLPAANSLPSAGIETLIWPTGPRDDAIPAEEAADFFGGKITVTKIYLTQLIRATGRVEKIYPKALEIVVDQPDQIEIVE